MALLFTMMLTFLPAPAQAETLTLSCFKGVVYVIDTSAKTAIAKGNGYTIKFTDVAISNDEISFVSDVAGDVRRNFKIDRTTGSIFIENYYYPQSGIKGASSDSAQCSKIANKAF